MSPPITLQDAILRLSAFWAEQGCLVWQPCNTEVGAGTMNPATFLRVLGPEPWRVAYVEPSVRPDDSRYGFNPNRLQMHTQYQVILKPDPGNPQEIYLQSLEVLGVNPRTHDIRFVEDNWESPALGAWGLGWEVWLDGLEITQFTYFQQSGGVVLDPVSVEITYGLERIVMALQGVSHFKHIRYAPGVSYDEVLGRNEYEMSVYNLDRANVERMQQLFALYEAEAQDLLRQELAIPAYFYVLKTSHIFNILDSRGCVGVTERAHFFARMRNLARRVAELWVARPVGTEPVAARQTTPAPAAAPPLPTPGAGPPADRQRRETLLLEIGTEELPPGDLDEALAQLQRLVPELLEQLRLAHGEITIAGTPRRLAVLVRELAACQPDEELEVRGPRYDAAFDAAGNPTPAAQGFARSQGVDVSQLEKKELKGGAYVVARVRKVGRPAVEVLASPLSALPGQITFGRGMRWNSPEAFSRPVRWLVALWGEQIIPCTYSCVAAGRSSRGLRNAPQPTFEIPHADQYERLLAEQQIVLHHDRRRELVLQQARQLAVEVGGRIPPQLEADLAGEVANLVESPLALRGSFEESYLSLPRDVLTTVMRKHQRYFPIEDSRGALLPHFVAVANGRVDLDAVRQGNEAVLRARFADARFFWEEDLKQPLEAFRDRLGGLAFHERLGSMRLKNDRLESLVAPFAGHFQLSSDECQTLARAARLCKADLATEMVVEFTSLAGLMGRAYALQSGEPHAVAEAIYEHVLPRFSGDALPQSRPGIALAVADRLDSLVGLFGVGLAPKSSADPFGLRRAALGVIQILRSTPCDIDVRRLVRDVAAVQTVELDPAAESEVVAFLLRRFEQLLLEEGRRIDLIRAVLSPRGPRIRFADQTLHTLHELADTEQFRWVMTAFSRPVRLVSKQRVSGDVNPQLFEAPAEQAVYDAWRSVTGEIHPDIPLERFVALLERLQRPIDQFFTEVFVMVDDLPVRENRLRLMQHIADLARGVIDLLEIEGY